MAFKREIIDFNPLCTTDTCKPTGQDLITSMTGPEKQEGLQLSPKSEGILGKIEDTLSTLFKKQKNHELAKENAEYQLQDLTHRAKHATTTKEKDEIHEKIRKIENQLDSIQEYAEDRESYHLEWLRGHEQAI